MQRLSRQITVMVFAMILAACGGGGSEPPPAAPQNAAAVVNGLQVDLSWDAVTNAEGYNIYWHDNGATSSTWTLLQAVTGTSFSHTGLSNGVTYSYQITTTKGSLESDPSTAASATTPPAVPQNAAASATDSQVNLSWDAVINADGYNIYWHDNGATSSTWTFLQSVTATSFSHTGLTNDVTYSYQVIATIGSLEGDPSTAVSATPRVVPATVGLISANITHAAVDDNPLTLSWPAATDATLYRVHYSTSSAVSESDPFLETTGTSLTVSTANNFGLLDGERYYFRVAAVNIDVVGTLSSEIAVAAQPKWNFLSPGHGIHAGTTDYKEAMAYDPAGGIYLHVGDNGLIARSTDGANWSVQHSGADGYHFTAAVWAGSRFVVLGSNDGNTQAVVLTSPDGIDWTFTPGLVEPKLSAIAWDGTNLLAVGYGVAASSSDLGASWTPITDMSGANVANAWFTDVIWDGSRFVISELGQVVASSDLLNWTFYSPSSSLNAFALAWDGTGYVVATTSGLYTSTDLTTWSQTQAVPGGYTYYYFTDVVWDAGNGLFLALGVDGLTAASASVYTSPDGTTWTEQLAGESQHAKALFSAGGQSFFLGGRGTFLSSSDDITWTPADAVDAATLTGLTPVGTSGWAAVGSDATIGTSADGNTWSWSTRTCSTWTTGSNWSGIIHNGSQYLAVGNEGCMITSSDGVTWTEQTSGVTENLADVVWDGSQFVVIGLNGTLITSPDGVTWTAQTSPTSKHLVRLVYADGTYVAIGNAGTIITSNDAINWTEQTSGTTVNLRGLAYYNGQYLVGGFQGRVLTSSDAITWTVATISEATGVRTTGITDAGYFAFSDNGTWYTSSDGSTWTQQPLLPMRSAYRFVVNASGRMMVSGMGGLLMSQ